MMTTLLRRIALTLLTIAAAYPLLLVLNLHGHSQQDDVAIVPRPNRFVVEVKGREFDWHFRYIDPAVVPLEGETTTDTSLYVPRGAELELRITSDDYIYPLNQPQLGINVVAVPGIVNVAVCDTSKSLERDLPADPLCGFRFYHDASMGRIVIADDCQFRAAE